MEDTDDDRRKALWARDSERHRVPPPALKPAKLPRTRSLRRPTLTRSAYQEELRGRPFLPLRVAEALDHELIEGACNPVPELRNSWSRRSP